MQTINHSRSARLGSVRGSDALLTKLLARVEAHRASDAKVPTILAAEPGSGKTALLVAMTRTWREAGMSVAAYAPQHAKSPGLAEFLKLASTTERQLGPLTIVLDGLEACSNPEEFARAAIALAQDGHTVVVGCRPSVLKHLPDAVLLLPVGESLRFTESDFVSWIRDEVPTAVARKLEEKRGQKWLKRAFEVSEGLALYASVIVRGLSDGSLQPEGSSPRLDEEWARMLSDAGVLDDSGRLALLLSICQMPASSWQAQETLAAFLDVDPTVSMPAIRDFLNAEGQPFHALLREFVLTTPRLDHMRKVARERWLASAFANPMRSWTQLPELAETLGVHEEGWARLIEGGAFLPWLSRECLVNESWTHTLAEWAHLAGNRVPAELAEWLAIFRECAACDWATSVSPQRTKTQLGDWFVGSAADFILDRVYERPTKAELARRALGDLTEVDSYRPCRRVNAASALPVRFQFHHEVVATGIGNQGKYLATLGPKGELSVDGIADGYRNLQSFATGVVAKRVWLAMSDKLQAVAIGHADEPSEIIVVYFAEQPPRMERHEWRRDGRVVIDRATQHTEGPFDLPHGLLAYLECHTSARIVSNEAGGHVVDNESDVLGFYHQPSVDLTARRSDDDSWVVEISQGSRRHVVDGIDRTLGVDGHVARFQGEQLSVYDADGMLKLRERVGRQTAPPAGRAHFASPSKLVRIVCSEVGVRLNEVATYVQGERRDAAGGYRRLLKSIKGPVVWLDPDGVETEPQWPVSPISTLRCEVENDNHLLVRDLDGNVVADWWGRVALYSPVMLRADRVAVLEGDALVVLSIDLPS